MDILTEHVGYSYGQHDFVITAAVDGETVGALSFSEFDGKPKVSMVEVKKSFREHGVARRMIERLQLQYPEEPIDFGYLSGDGARMLDRIDFRVVENPLHANAIADKERIEFRLEEFERTAERLRTATGSLRDELMQSLDGWNDALDALDEAELTISTEPRELKFVIVQDRPDSEASVPLIGR